MIHRQGRVVGSLGSLHLGIDTDDNIVLQKFWTTIPYEGWNRCLANLPPEYHHQLPAIHSGSRIPVVPATDLYQLGLTLWKLAAHIVHLPSIGPPVPHFLAEIIRICLSEDPRQRKRAVELLELFPDTGAKACRDAFTTPAEISLRSFAQPGDFLAVYGHCWCNFCGQTTTSYHYHCRCCNSGDLDLCESCFIKGRHCNDDSHYLMEIQDIGETSEGSYFAGSTGGGHGYFTSPKEDRHRDYVFM